MLLCVLLFLAFLGMMVKCSTGMCFKRQSPLTLVCSVALKSEIRKLNIVHVVIWVLIAAQVKSRPVQVQTGDARPVLTVSSSLR